MEPRHRLIAVYSIVYNQNVLFPPSCYLSLPFIIFSSLCLTSFFLCLAFCLLYVYLLDYANTPLRQTEHQQRRSDGKKTPPFLSPSADGSKTTVKTHTKQLASQFTFNSESNQGRQTYIYFTN